MRKILIGLLFLLLFISSCKDKGWQPIDTILLDGIAPIGIAFWNDEIWLSDGDNNRMVVIDESGKILREIGPIERPMHIITRNEKMYVPSYGTDEVLIFGEASLDTLRPGIELEGPGGIDIHGDFVAIADFYNHRVITYNGSEWNIIGGKGKDEGEFNYPTDLNIANDKIWVADAYNNRIQVFDMDGNFEMSFGEDEKMNAATGIYVDDSDVYVTDFENSRVFQYDQEGTMVAEINTGLNKPTDVIINKGEMWILNYGGKYISRYTN